jgi:DNA polymerase elongation subunit (family B)
MTARVLFLDIETSPTVADVWSLRDLSVGISQIKVQPRMIGFGYRWSDSKRKAQFVSEYHHGHFEMVSKARDLLDEADALCGYNSQGFDAKHLNSEFVVAGLTPPSPYKHIDLYKVVRANFRLPSYKLQYVLQRLDLGSKLPHTGHQMWIDCLGDDEERKAKAWKLMSRYCRQDVDVLPALKEALLPWMGGPFNAGNYAKTLGQHCPSCGSENVQSRGVQVTTTLTYTRFQCQSCGRWSRSKKSIDSVDLR